MIVPARVPLGGNVALVAAAGPLPDGGIDRAVKRVESLGWKPVVGRHAERKNGYLAGHDAHRVADLNYALRSPDIDAIWMLRGGYGTMRILPDVDFGALVDRPRPLIGFSDNTALHLAAHRLNLITFHGPHPAAADLSDFSLECLTSLLSGDGPATLPFPGERGDVHVLLPGQAEGRLVGGNLSLLAATAGTPYQMRAEGSIVFIEEVNEPAYRLDRLLSQLLLAGIFDGAVGVVVGAISACPDLDNPDLPDPIEIIADRLAHLNVPLAVGFPFGHISESWTLPVGARALFDTDGGEVTILDPVVR